MLQRLSKPEPFGKAGLIVAVVALVAALAGTAFAAKYVVTSTKQIKPSVLTALKGKTGPQGLPGANGKDGPQGPKGDSGAAGRQGPPGTDGTFSTEPLPKEQTLAGAWSVSGSEGEHLATISFPIAVSPPPTTLLEFNGLGIEPAEGSFEIYPFGHFPGTQQEEEEAREAYEEACPGSAGFPAAAPGFLCIYTGSSNLGSGFNLSLTNWEIAHEFGVSEPFNLSGSGESLYVKGSWAVTAE